MAYAGGMRRAVRLSAFLATALLGSGCDLATKSWAESRLLELPGRTLDVVAPWLQLEIAYNQGTAFSVVHDLGGTRVFMGGLALLLTVGMALWTSFDRRLGPLEVLSLGLIGGGAVGNGLDRLFNLLPDGGTGVVDFIRVNYPWGGSWPTFNVADALVLVGAVGFYWASWRRRRRGV